MVALPRGGRLISPSAAPVAAHTAGALGSVGLFGVTAIAFVAWTSGWHPASLSDVALCVAAVIVGGLSLAAVFRAMDRTARQLTRPGEVVGRGARRVLRRFAWLSERAERAPDQLDARFGAALRWALSAAAEPEIARWIPADVRGRGELLLARVETRRSGPGWARDEEQRARIRELLIAARGRLADPRPAEADLAALDQAPRALRAAPKRTVRIAVVLTAARATSGASSGEAPTADEEPIPAPARRALIVRR
jgi:hypothetical protein